MGKKSREKQNRKDEQKDFIVEKRSRSSMSKIENFFVFVFYSSIFLMLLTPLLVGESMFFPFVSLKGLYLMALIEVSVASGLFLIIYSPKYRVKKDALFIAIGFFILIMTLATILGVDPLNSFWSKFERMSGLLMWLHLFGFFIVARAILKKDDWLRIFYTSIIISIIVCIFFWLNNAGVKNLPVGYNGSTVGNSSFLATYLLFNLFFAIYLFFELKKQTVFLLPFLKKAKKTCLAILILGFIFMFITLMYSTGRAAILAFFGAFGLLILLYFALEYKKPKIKFIAKILLIFGLVIYLAGITALLWHNSPAQQWLSENANKSRQVIWQNAWQGFLERPILGWGPENFAVVFHKFFDPGFYLPDIYGPDTRFDRAHNIIFDNLVDGGAAGLIGYLSMFGVSFFILWRGYKKGKISFIAAAIPTVILVAHFTQNLTVFDMPASFLMIFLTFIFVSVVSRDKSTEENISMKTGKNKIIFLPIILILLFFFFSSFVIKPARAATGIIGVMKNPTFEAREPFYSKALNSSPMGLYQIREHLGSNIFTLMNAGVVTVGDFKFASESLEKTVANSPFDYYSRIVLGRVYNAYAGLQPDKREVVSKRAEQVLEQALQLSPTKQEGYWEMAKTKEMLNKNNEAAEFYEKAIALEPRVLESYQLAISFYKKIGDIEKAKQTGDRLLKYYPELEASLRQFLEQGNTTTTSANY
ncbi:MAG: O-antigen ligase family protein [Candidatus Parcubacteria bacterium]|nr:O-antigen ligase family protein [Candidatus Parcubacteria bacterium]